MIRHPDKGDNLYTVHLLPTSKETLKEKVHPERRDKWQTLNESVGDMNTELVSPPTVSSVSHRNNPPSGAVGSS